MQRVQDVLEKLRLDGLIAIGGEDTLGVANRLYSDGVNVIGVPKTIDNDLGGTDVTFGFDTALHIATEAIDRLHTTAESHNRILVVEVMGRTAGWIALHSGRSRRRRRDPDPGDPVRHRRGVPADPPATCARPVLLDRGRGRGRDAQGGDDDGSQTGAVDEFGHPRLGGIGYALEREIEGRTGLRDARHRARARPARRHPDRVRPRARDAGSGSPRSTRRTRASGG